eukprot:TCONS_00068485-protein
MKNHSKNNFLNTSKMESQLILWKEYTRNATLPSELTLHRPRKLTKKNSKENDLAARKCPLPKNETVPSKRKKLSVANSMQRTNRFFSCCQKMQFCNKTTSFLIFAFIVGGNLVVFFLGRSIILVKALVIHFLES